MIIVQYRGALKSMQGLGFLLIWFASHTSQQLVQPDHKKRVEVMK